MLVIQEAIQNARSYICTAICSGRSSVWNDYMHTNHMRIRSCVKKLHIHLIELEKKI